MALDQRFISRYVFFFVSGNCLNQQKKPCSPNAWTGFEKSVLPHVAKASGDFVLYSRSCLEPALTVFLLFSVSPVFVFCIMCVCCRGCNFLQREDLNHTGAHKINNSIAQALLAVRLGKTRIIAETGAGQHGVATATVCARFGLKCVVYMGATDMERQALNVFRMRLLGAEIVPVTFGRGTLTNALSQAIRDWVTYPIESHYIVGSVAGPHPYPMIVRDFQSLIGEEVRDQALEKWSGKPDILIACVGGGSNAMGLFNTWKDDESVRLIGVEAAGEGLSTEKHAASLTKGTLGVLHGAMSYQLQDEWGNISEAHSISAGLDYPGVGPEHSFMKDTGRCEYVSITDDEALDAFKLTSRLEGIIPALETSHAIAYLEKLCPALEGSPNIVLNCSGRGDKDVTAVMDHLKKRGDSDIQFD